MNQPNIIMITTDQQRYDTLGATGNHQIHTPHCDALAARGTLFERAYVQNPVCIPSRACLQTGRYTHQHGVTYMADVVDETPGLPAWEITFMERLQATGYRTGATGKLHMLPPKGFDYERLCGGKGFRWTQAHGQPIGPAPLGPTYAAWLEARHRGGYEYIFWGGGCEAESYDLQEDPAEQVNLAGDPAYRGELKAHQELLIERLLASEQHYDRDESPTRRDLHAWL